MAAAVQQSLSPCVRSCELPVQGAAPRAAAAASSACHALPAAGASSSGEGAVEVDPSLRYIRYPVLLGRGACKRVYKAFDQVDGIEVAWNKAELGHDMEPEQRERLFAEIRVLKTLRHRNIMAFYDWWFDEGSQCINFITEYFTSGTLRQFRKRHARHVSETAVKRWAFQILEGLLYLHAHSPPIVHRDLKCDNILVNGTSGQVKIADLGLASCQRGLSVVGTPEFMAPEMYDEVYDEKVDIYAFGMCLLELATLEYPYSECRSIPAIFRKVSQGIPPAALSKVASPALQQLITTCICQSPDARPGALQLLKHPLFADLSADGQRGVQERPCGSPTSSKAACSAFSPPFGSCGNLMALASGSVTSRMHNVRAFMHGDGPLQGAGAAPAPAPAAAAGQHQEGCACTASQSAAATAVLRATPGSATTAPEPCSSCTASQAAPAGATGAGTSRSSPLPQLACRGGVRPLLLDSEPEPEALPCQAAPLQCLASRPGSCATSASGSAATAAAASNGFARGTTICVAAVVGRSAEQDGSDDEDSDDEVLVSLEDVLAPHPEDLLDPQTAHLNSTLTHAGSGCTIVSAPGCQLAEGLSSLLKTMSLDPESFGGPIAPAGSAAGLLSRYSSCATAQSQQLALLQQLQAQAQPQAQPQALEGQPGAGSRGSCHSAGAASRPASATAAAAAAAESAAGDASAAGRASRSGAADVGGDAGSVPPAAAALLRTISNLGAAAGPGSAGLNCRHMTGALAAAGLLQLSPGLFMPTPALLEKLLSKTAATGGRASLGSSTADAAAAAAAGPAPAALALAAGAAGQSHRPTHCRFSSSEAALRAWAGGAADAGLAPGAGALDGGACGRGVDARVAAAAAGAGTDGAAAGTAAAGGARNEAGAQAAAPAALRAGTGYGRILVRRRFVRQQPAVVLPLQRSSTL